MSPGRHKLNCVIRFRIKASNKETEYEALLAGLKLSRKMQVKRLMFSNDSQLVVRQVKGDFTARDKNMASYLKKVIELFMSFESLNELIYQGSKM